MPSASAISPDILDTPAGVRLALLGLGYNPGDSKRTLQAAVKQFQAHHGGLTIDGIAGPQTKAAILRSLAALNPIDLVFIVELNRAGTIETKLDKVLRNQETIMASIDDVAADVTAEGSVIDSISVLEKGLKQMLADALANQTVPPAVQSAIDSVFATVEANKAKLAQAVLDGTP